MNERDAHTEMVHKETEREVVVPATTQYQRISIWGKHRARGHP